MSLVIVLVCVSGGFAEEMKKTKSRVERKLDDSVVASLINSEGTCKLISSYIRSS